MPRFARIGLVTLCAAVSVVLTTVGLGVSAGWAQQPQGTTGSRSGPPVAPTSPPRKPVGVDREALRRFVAERDQARRDKKAARDSEGERRERRASRTRYRDLDSGQARELARRHLKRAFEARRDPVKGPGVSVDAYLGDRAARVELASGQKAIVESLLPLRTPDASGALEPIDLTVRDAGDAFEPVHAASKVRLPKRLRGGDVELGDSGLRIEIPAPQSDTPGSGEDGGVFYANAEAATDVAVIPEMTGVEVSYLLRSADAPERFVLRYGGGVVLRDTKEGGVDVLRDGKPVAQVTPPKAWDADGQPVPMRLKADGDRLIVEVDHRDGDYAYPIVADPYTGEDFAYSDGRTVWWDQTGWDRVSTAGSANPRRFFEDQQCTDTGGRFCFGHWPGWIYGTGLYTWMRSGYTPGFNNTYNYGDIGEWIFQAPGQSYIYRFDMWQLRNEYDSSCSYQGLFSPRSNSWEEQSYWDPWGGAHTPARRGGDYPPRLSCGTSNTDWLAVCAGAWECRNGEADYGRHIREGGNYAVFGTQIPNTRVPSFTNFMGAANISIGDRDNPQINTLTGPTGWTRDPTAKINAGASDPGLGVRQLKLYAPDQPSWNGTRDTTPACNGDRNSRCATSRAHTVDLGDLREGRNRILAEATDPVDRRSPQREINVNVDRSGPDIDPATGFLVGTAERIFRGESYDFSVSARDSLSGVASIELLLDGVAIAGSKRERTAPCDGCILSLEDFDVTTDALGAGPHVVTVRAYDAAGNPRSADYPFDVVDVAARPLDNRDSSEFVEPEEPTTAQDDAAVGTTEPDACIPDATNGADVDCSRNDSGSSTDQAVRAEPALRTNAVSPALVGGVSSPPFAPPAGSDGDLERGATGWGLSDQKSTIFSAPYATELDALSVERVRLIVPWDVVTRGRGYFSDKSTDRYPKAFRRREGPSEAFDPNLKVAEDPGTLREVVRWIAAALPCGRVPKYEVLVSFEKTRGPSRGRDARTLPTPAEYETATRAFLNMFNVRRCSGKRAIKLFSAWNEPNYDAQPTYGPFVERAGVYWSRLNKTCHTTYACSVAAGEFVDRSPTQLRLAVRRFKTGMNRSQPAAAWALHAYGLSENKNPNGTDRNSTLSKTREEVTKFLTAIGPTPKLWLTEQGGRYDVPNASDASALGAECRLMRFREFSDRITRFFHYELTGPTDADVAGGEKFDSALISRRGSSSTKRDQFDVYRFFSAKTGFGYDKCPASIRSDPLP